MRRRLILVFLAVSTLVATAFVVPLGFVVRRTAEDRAIDTARAEAAAVVPSLVAQNTKPQIEAAVALTRAGQEGRMSIITSQGWTIGAVIEPSPLMQAALRNGASAIGETEGGVEVVAAVASGPDELSAIRVFVPDEVRRSGQWRAWSVLATVGVALVAISVLVADRLARTVVQPTSRLADAAKRLGAGDLETTVEPEGPEELVELAGAFNDLGARVSTMLERERELVAELSHRLRTPLTKLRLRVDQVGDPELAGELRADVDDVTSVVNALIQQARGTAEPARCDADRVVAERADFWQVLAEDQQRAWSLARAGRPLPVAVAEVDLAATVDVLIENVFAHTDEGIALAITCREVGGCAEIQVEDSGPGIASAESARGVSGAGSTGLGLDIARRVAESSGGALELGESTLGGASIVLLLPIAGDGSS